MKLFLKVWRQEGPSSGGNFETHTLDGVSEDSSFLEMLDQLNEQLLAEGIEPVVFDHDCREGICGMCSLTINGLPHGPEDSTTTCQLHMRKFSDGEVITIEPFRAKAFPVVRDLVVDRSAFDRITQAGGFITVRTGSAPDGNALPVPKDDSDKAMDAARNADTLAQHFYEQGKADAVKEVMAKSKNISTEPRQTASGEVFVNGLKVKAISGVDSSKLKVKKVTLKN